MSEKQLFVDRNFDQSGHVESKIFLSQVVAKIPDYKTHTFKILCLSDAGRQTHFFPDFLIFETRNFHKCSIQAMLPARQVSLIYKNEKPRFWTYVIQKKVSVNRPLSPLKNGSKSDHSSSKSENRQNRCHDDDIAKATTTYLTHFLPIFRVVTF